MHNVDQSGRTALIGLLHAAGAVQAHVESKLAVIGLSLPKLAALAALHDAGDLLPLSQLAERLSCVKSNITQLVDRLESDGLVRRLSDPNDRRTRIAILTPAGRLAWEEGTRIRANTERHLLGGLTRDEARHLEELVEKIEQRASMDAGAAGARQLVSK